MAYERKPHKLTPPNNSVLRARSPQFNRGTVQIAAAREEKPLIKASKGARELAKKRGIKLETLTGTGDQGSITVEDVRRVSGGI